MNVMITGASGLVGNALCSLLSSSYTLLTPSRREMDILDATNVESYISFARPHAIIHAAAYVNATDAEGERGDLNGLCYRTNVNGAKHVVDAGHAVGAFVIYISTGSVFHGTDERPGPFEIDDEPESDLNKNGWYGYTKYLGEQMGADAIVRIAHPVVPRGVRDDYVQRMIRLYREGRLFPLFTDQYFPLTFLPDLSTSLTRIIEQRIRGIFHVASPDLVSPYELFTTVFPEYVGTVTKISIEQFYASGHSPLRYAKYSAIAVKKTEEILRLSFSSWRKIQDVAYA